MKVDRKNKIFYNDGQTTVCLILGSDQTVLARGIAICSRMDDFDGREGRATAQARAMEAVGRQADCGEIKVIAPRANPYDLIPVSLAKDRFGEYKGYYLPNLTPTEALLLELKFAPKNCQCGCKPGQSCANR